MKTVPLPIQGQVAASSIALATLWDIALRSGSTLYFTDHDAPLVYGGNSYTPYGGEASARSEDIGLVGGDVEFQALITSDAITEEDLNAGLYNEATITERLVNWRIPWAYPYRINKWKIGKVSWRQERGWWEGIGQDATRIMQNTIGHVYTRTCRHHLGDGRCGITLSSFTESGTVTVATDRRNFTCADAAITGEADDYWKHGSIEWTGGNNVNAPLVEVRESATGVIKLYEPLPYDIQVGDTFDLTAGCEHTLAACRDKFSNVANYGGFPTVPGNDQYFLTPNAKA